MGNEINKETGEAKQVFNNNKRYNEYRTQYFELRREEILKHSG